MGKVLPEIEANAAKSIKFLAIMLPVMQALKWKC